MKILVLGASGIAGRSLVPHLLAAGHDVAAQARTMARLRPPADAGATPVPADPTDPRVLRQLLRGRDAVYDLRVAIPPTTRAALPGAWRQYARLRGAGCGLVVDAALEAGMPRVIRDTVTMVYASGGDNWLDENHPARAHGSLAANLAAERHLARLSAAGGHGVAIRFGGFYGPGDNFSRDVIAAAMKGRALFTGPPDGWTSATHTTDVGTALAAALTVPAGIYNAVDDEPLTRRDLLDILAHAAGRPLRSFPRYSGWLASSPVRSLSRSHRVSNDRLRSLGWRPTIPSRRQGWPDTFAATTPSTGSTGRVAPTLPQQPGRPSDE